MVGVSQHCAKPGTVEAWRHLSSCTFLNGITVLVNVGVFVLKSTPEQYRSLGGIIPVFLLDKKKFMFVKLLLGDMLY